MNGRFQGEAAAKYGRQARRLFPDYDALHEVVAAELAGARSLLSVGCGDGEELARASADRKVGVDPSPDMTRIAEARLGDSADIRVGHVGDIDGSFEAVTAVLVGHFVPFAEREAFYRALRVRCEGKLILAELTAPIDGDRWVEKMVENGTEIERARIAVEAASVEVYPLSRDDLVAMVERAGFQLASEPWYSAPISGLSFRSL